MTAEIPKMVQQIGKGMASSDVAGVGLVAAATVTGMLWILVGGTVSNGCVFAIVTAGGGEAAGCGKMLMRAVSFFGPEYEAEAG